MERKTARLQPLQNRSSYIGDSLALWRVSDLCPLKNDACKMMETSSCLIALCGFSNFSEPFYEARLSPPFFLPQTPSISLFLRLQFLLPLPSVPCSRECGALHPSLCSIYWKLHQVVLITIWMQMIFRSPGPALTSHLSSVLCFFLSAEYLYLGVPPLPKTKHVKRPAHYLSTCPFIVSLFLQGHQWHSS